MSEARVDEREVANAASIFRPLIGQIKAIRRFHWFKMSSCSPTSDDESHAALETL